MRQEHGLAKRAQEGTDESYGSKLCRHVDCDHDAQKPVRAQPKCDDKRVLADARCSVMLYASPAQLSIQTVRLPDSLTKLHATY